MEPLSLLGLGILAGGKYLMGKFDAQGAEQSVSSLQKYMDENPDLVKQRPVAFQTLMDSAQEQSQSSSVFDRYPGAATRRTNKYVDAARQLGVSMENDQVLYDREQQALSAARQRDMADPYGATNMSLESRLADEWQQETNNFRETQNSYKSIMQALENPTRLNMEMAKYNIFSIVEPGGRVTENEDGTLEDTGGKMTNLLNLWNSALKGEAGAEQIRQIRDAVNRQYEPRYNQMMDTRSQFEKKWQDMNKHGRPVGTPFTRGIDADPSQIIRNAQKPGSDQPKGDSGLTVDTPGLVDGPVYEAMQKKAQQEAQRDYNPRRRLWN